MTKLFIALQTRIATLRDAEDGAAAVEYGLLVGLIAAILVTLITTLGTDVQAKFQAITNAIV